MIKQKLNQVVDKSHKLTEKEHPMRVMKVSWHIPKLKEPPDKPKQHQEKSHKQWHFEGHDWKYNEDQHTWEPPSPPTNEDNNITLQRADPTNSSTKIYTNDLKQKPTSDSKDADASLMKIDTTTSPIDGSQSDSGANTIVTDDLTKFVKYWDIEDYNMSGCNKDDPAALTCTKAGFIPVKGDQGQEMLIKGYYSPQVAGTIISPTEIVAQHEDKYAGWVQYADCANKKGYIKLIGHNGYSNFQMETVMKNKLWYHKYSPPQTHDDIPIINRLSSAALYELWHQRTAHAGKTCLTNLHKHVKGVPKLHGNEFYRCPSCMSGKLATKRAIGKERKSTRKKKRKSKEDATTDIAAETIEDYLDGEIKEGQPGQHFHMDFGFVRGSEYRKSNKDGKTVTSIDGKNSYLIIIDRCTRYVWIFCSASKTPPIEAARMILEKFKSTNTHRTVRVDQGGELGRSTKFQNMIAEAKFTLEDTGSDGSAQNGKAERPNRTFGEMMRCMLHSAELGPKYWSHALSHAVYIKNRLPHSSINMTPYEKMTGIKPDLSDLRIFGSRIYAKKPGRTSAKLDHHSSAGIFLGKTASTHNAKYIDLLTSKVKTATHIIYDEAHMTAPPNEAPISAQSLQRLGYSAKEDYDQAHIAHDATSSTLQIEKLINDIATPTRATSQSIGYDIASASSETIEIKAGETAIIPTGLKVKPPPGTYVRIAPRSGLTVKKNLTTMAGVIDPDF